MARLDAPSDWRPGGRGFSPRRGRQHSFAEIDHEIFSTVILSLPLIQEGQLSVSGERMCTILVNRLEDLACLYIVNVWLAKLTALDMTPLGWLGRKTSTQTNKHTQHSCEVNLPFTSFLYALRGLDTCTLVIFSAILYTEDTFSDVLFGFTSSRKHAYSNILKILPPKNENFR